MGDPGSNPGCGNGIVIGAGRISDSRIMPAHRIETAEAPIDCDIASKTMSDPV